MTACCLLMLKTSWLVVGFNFRCWAAKNLACFHQIYWNVWNNVFLKRWLPWVHEWIWWELTRPCQMWLHHNFTSHCWVVTWAYYFFLTMPGLFYLKRKVTTNYFENSALIFVLECILRWLAIVKEESLRFGVPLHSTDIQNLAWPPILLGTGTGNSHFHPHSHLQRSHWLQYSFPPVGKPAIGERNKLGCLNQTAWMYRST